MFSNRYTFIFSSILIVVVGVFLALAANGLKPFQEANKKIEKIQYILNSAHIENTKSNAQQVYQSHLLYELLVDEQGNILEKYDYKTPVARIPFEVNIKEAFKNFQEKGKAELPVYVLKKGTDTLHVFPMFGTGLWGPIWGYMAVKNDFETIEGAVFDHEGETPGLGAEIATPKFQAQFPGKKFIKNNEIRPPHLVKGGASNSAYEKEYDVDAISGGTITSKGTTAMIEKAFSFYKPFILKNRKKFNHEDK